MRARRKNSKGQSIVEMTVLLPLLVLVLVVAADFARVFYESIEVANAARAGVQYGAQNYVTAADFTGMQNAALEDGSNISGLTAAASYFCTCNGQTVACSPPVCSEPQVFVKVQTNATFSTILDYPGIGNSIPLSTTAILEVQ